MGALKLIYKSKSNFENEDTAMRYGLEGDNVRGKGKKGAKLKRIGAAILTGGASEMARFAAGKIKKMSPAQRKRLAAAVISGGASELGRAGLGAVKKMPAQNRVRLAKAIATGGASEAVRTITGDLERSFDETLEMTLEESFEALEYENAKGKKKASGGAKKAVRKQKIKAAIKKVGGKVKAASKKGLQYAKYSALTPLFAPVLPFKIPMVVMLNKRGIKTNIAEPIAMVAEKFVKYIGKNYVKNSLYGESLDCFDSENYTGFESMEDSVETFAPAVVKAAQVALKIIIAVFKKIKEKKQAGQPMTEDEKAADIAAEKSAEATQGQSQEEIARTVKEPSNTQEVKLAVDKAEKEGTKPPQDTDEPIGRPAAPKTGFSISGMMPLLILAVIAILVMKE